MFTKEDVQKLIGETPDDGCLQYINDCCKDKDPAIIDAEYVCTLYDEFTNPDY